MERLNPFNRSPLVEKASATGVIRAYDIDGTMAMGGVPTLRELHARREVRRSAGNDCAEVATSARTPELIMLSDEYWRSRELGFLRPPPRSLRRTFSSIDEEIEYQFVEPLENLIEYESVARDFDAIMSMGVIDLVRQHTGGYMPDLEYELSFTRSLPKKGWRNAVWEILLDSADVGGDILSKLASIEFVGAYRNGKADVVPLPYRFQLDWNECEEGDARSKKVTVRERLRACFARENLPVRFIDESNPAKGRYTLYLLHPAVTKEAMLERLLSSVFMATGMRPEDLTLDIFGDTLTDLRQVLAAGPDFCREHGGRAVTMNFFLAGGSRLSTPILNREQEFAGEDLTRFHAHMEQSGQRGVYYVHVGGERRFDRRLIIADEAFPDLPGPESIEAFFGSGLADACV